MVEDATAEMRGGDPGPILETWRKAIDGGQPFCLAANEYPLYQLRMADMSAPHLVEVGGSVSTVWLTGTTGASGASATWW